MNLQKILCWWMLGANSKSRHALLPSKSWGKISEQGSWGHWYLYSLPSCIAASRLSSWLQLSLFCSRWFFRVITQGNTGNIVENIEYPFPEDYLIQSGPVFQFPQISLILVWAFPQVLHHIFCLPKPEIFSFPHSMKISFCFELNVKGQ